MSERLYGHSVYLYFLKWYNIIFQPTEERVKDIIDKKFLSLEGTKVKAEYDRKMALANLHKQQVLDQLAELKERFAKIMERYKY